MPLRPTLAFLLLLSVSSLLAAPPTSRLVPITPHRKIYLRAAGHGSPTVVLVAGLRASADDWTTGAQGAPSVFAQVAKFTRVLAYDRPGTPVGEQPSRSDPVPQPVTAARAVADLHALLHASGEPAPYVLVGLVAKLYARTYPREVAGLVLIDALTEGLQDAETPAHWKIQRRLLNGEIRDSLKIYPALERIDPDRSFAQLRHAPPFPNIPLTVLSADQPWGPLIPPLIANGTLPADIPKDFGYIVDRAQKQAQQKLARLTPTARHITRTHSGHEIHKQQPNLVTTAIRQIVNQLRTQPPSHP